ncbi:MAG: sensor histidine kinase [Mycobacterium leprae]
MSLRTRLIWAFVAVAALALLLAGGLTNVGMYRIMYMPDHAGFMGRGMMGGGYGMMGGPAAGGAGWGPQFMRAIVTYSLRSSILALVLAAVVGYFVAGRITKHLRVLNDAARGVGLRDLARRVPPLGKDEIGELAGNFNRMCDRLEAEERARRQLLADVAHELRHPLTVLQGRLDLMAEGKVPLEQEALLPLEDEVIRLTRLVGDLRDLSLAEVGGLSLHRSAVDLGGLLRSVLTNLEPVAADRSIRLTADLAPDLPPVVADADRIRQVLVNLLANALQYTPAGGQVTVTGRVADAPAGGVQIQVTDTGSGISPEDLPHVFDRFYRSDRSRTRATGGSGLGLAIVRSLVELHGGSVTVTSQLGQGSCFTVWLPGPSLNNREGAGA